MAVVAVLATCWFAKTILVPIVAALLVHSLFSPVVRSLRRRGVPRVVSAIALILSLTSILTVAGIYLAEPAQRWFEELPRNLPELRRRLDEVLRPVAELADATAKVEEMARIEGKTPKAEEVVVVEDDSPLSILLGRVHDTGVSIFIVLTLLFLLLANEGSFVRSLQAGFGSTRGRGWAMELTRLLQHDLSWYLITVTLINSTLGLVVGVSLWIIGMPNPTLWGVMAAVFNFVPYVGMTVGVGIVGFVALLTFESSSHALLAPGAYFVLSALEGGIITPSILGQRLALSPVAVFVAILVWSFLWGVPGAILAVPLVVTTKIACEPFERLRPLAQLLSLQELGRPSKGS